MLLPLKVLLAAAAAAPELILQVETFLRVIPCFGGEKRAWSHWEVGGSVFSSSTSLLSPLAGEGRKATVVAHVVGRTEQKVGSSPALKFHKHLGLTGFSVCSSPPLPPRLRY